MGDPYVTRDWRDEQAARLQGLDNHNLWREFLNAQIPDDYDGGFTHRSSWLRDYTRSLVEQRLGPWLQDMDHFAIGKIVTHIRTMDQDEALYEGWPLNRPVTVLALSDGSVIYASKDEEGNGPGELFGRRACQGFLLYATPPN